MHLVEDGVYHMGDEMIRNQLEDVDPLGYSLNCSITCEEQRPNDIFPIPTREKNLPSLEDSKPFEDVFAAYRNDDMDDIRARLCRLNEGHVWRLRTSLALLALQECNAAVLSGLLDDGVETEESFEDEVRRVVCKRDPQTHKLLQNYAARKQTLGSDEERYGSAHDTWKIPPTSRVSVEAKPEVREM